MLEFIKRFLIVTIIPDAILDLYYITTNQNEQELVAYSLSIQQN